MVDYAYVFKLTSIASNIGRNLNFYTRCVVFSAVLFMRIMEQAERRKWGALDLGKAGLNH